MELGTGTREYSVYPKLDFCYVQYVSCVSGSYPGAACDVQSYHYLPLLAETGFIPSKKFVGQEEIQNYAKQIAEQFGL